MKVLFFFVCLGLVLGCGHIPKKEPVGYGPRQFWKDQSLRLAKLNQFSAKIYLGVRGRGAKGSGSGQMIAQLPDRFRLEIRGPIGRLQFVAAQNGRNLTAYYPQEAKAFLDGGGGRAYLQKMAGLNMEFGVLQYVFIGVLSYPTVPKSFKSWQWDSRAGLYVGKIEQSGTEIEVWVDPQLSAIRKVLITENEIETQIDYSEFKRTSSQKLGAAVALARRVIVENKKLETSVNVQWKAMNPLRRTPKASVFQVKLPSGTLTEKMVY